MKFLYLILALSAVFSCRSKSASKSDNRAANALAFFQSSSSIELDVWYESSAKPYVKDGFTNEDYWSILRNNLNAIFQYRSAPPTLQVPSELSDMHELPLQNKESYTSSDILALAAAHSSGPIPSGSSRFTIFFLNAHFQDSNGVNKNVLGVSIGDSNILAIFKPVIAGTAQGGPLDRTAKLVEQSTLVHEMGHALGFVNNGVPMVKDYQDIPHGAHSTDTDCVMYWANETTDDLAKFVAKFLTSGNEILWGPDVLADAKAISK
jgi:hypothetical protein